MFELKPLHPDSIPAALEKATRYRLLNESGEAESICLDVLRVVPDHPQALVTLLLAIANRFEKGYAIGATRAHEVLAQLRDDYGRAYYAGLIAERQAKALLKHNSPGAGFDATNSAARPWTITKRPNRFAPSAMTTPCSAGTPAPVSSWPTGSNRAAKVPMSRRWSSGGLKCAISPLRRAAQPGLHLLPG